MRTILKEVSQELPVEISFLRDKFLIKANDEYLIELLKMAIDEIELTRGISLRKKVLRLIHDNNNINLNFSPVNRIISIKDSNGKSVEPIKQTRMHDRIMFKFEEDLGPIAIEYEVGYSKENLPHCLLTSLVEKFYDLHCKNEEESKLDVFGYEDEQGDYVRL